MNTYKQFWALFKFQQSVNPMMVFMPLAFAMPFFITSGIGGSFRPSLDLLLSNQEIYLIGIIAVMWLAPEMFRRGETNSLWSDGMEFLLTRAVDRRIVTRARLVFFYLLVFLVPTGIFCLSLTKPELKISEYKKFMYEQVLEKVPGSRPIPSDEAGEKSDLIAIPHGEALVAGFRLCLFVIITAALQSVIFLIYPWKYRKPILLTLYIALLFMPLLGIGSSDRISSTQELFFFYAGHQALCWVVVVVALLLGQIWSEWRFARSEQSAS